VAAVQIALVSARAELEQVLALQRENLRGRLAPEQESREGFVTAEHTLEVLERMHALAPSVIARDGGRVVGYALVMLPQARPLVPILEPMFALYDTLCWRGQPLGAQRFYVMGQICVASSHRGRGVFDALYRAHREHYADRYELCVTEVATRNARSLRAHRRVGFEQVAVHCDALDEWAVVAWDWSAPSERAQSA
jgi:ribosomal protein S18 acetylase RimI-like enzyme